MTKKLSILAATVLASATLISCGGGDAITPGGSLFTNAPSTVTLNPGAEVSYRLNGGSPLYSASSGNNTIVTARVVGGELILTGVSVGSTSVSIVDTQGSKITLTVAVGGSGTGGPLFTNAPSAVVLDAASSATYSLGGGRPPYSAVSGNTNVVKATVDTDKLTLTAMSPGDTSIAVSDAAGAKVNVNVTISAQGVGAPISLTPASLEVGNCTTRIPFLFSGGIPPYTVLSSDNFDVPVSSPISLGDGRFYFFADVHWPYPIINNLPPFRSNQTLTVLDSQSRTAVAIVSTPEPTSACPSNPLLTISPESANFRMSQNLAFQVSGGPATRSAPTVTFADAGVAEVVAVTVDPAIAITVRACGAEGSNTAICPVRRSTLMTVATSDGQRATVVINVLPQP